MKTLNEVRKYADEKDKNLQSSAFSIFKSPSCVSIRHIDGSCLSFVYATYEILEDWLIIYTEHHGVFTYHSGDITYFSMNVDIPQNPFNDDEDDSPAPSMLY